MPHAPQLSSDAWARCRQEPWLGRRGRSTLPRGSGGNQTRGSLPARGAPCALLTDGPAQLGRHPTPATTTPGLVARGRTGRGCGLARARFAGREAKHWATTRARHSGRPHLARCLQGPLVRPKTLEPVNLGVGCRHDLPCVQARVSLAGAPRRKAARSLNSDCQRPAERRVASGPAPHSAAPGPSCFCACWRGASKRGAPALSYDLARALGSLPRRAANSAGRNSAFARAVRVSGGTTAPRGCHTRQCTRSHLQHTPHARKGPTREGAPRAAISQAVPALVVPPPQRFAPSPTRPPPRAAALRPWPPCPHPPRPSPRACVSRPPAAPACA